VAYATILIGMIYFGIQKAYGLERLKATFKSKMAIFLITFGVLGMTVALTIAGYEQVLVERAELGGTLGSILYSTRLTWDVQGQSLESCNGCRNTSWVWRI